MPSSSTASISCLKGLDFTTDLTSLSYVEVLSDEMQATTVGFLLSAIAWFDSQGISCKRVLSDVSVQGSGQRRVVIDSAERLTAT